MQAQTKLNQYVFLNKLGDGGMGEVWRGKHNFLDYEVAIKFLKPEYTGNTELQDRFLNEGKRQAHLDHPNIVRAIDFVTDSDARNYLVMKYVEGIGLDKRIEDAAGPLDLGEIVSVSSQVLRALDYAHSRGVIHRDVKPSNILIDEESKCYLTDFGIALAVGQLRRTSTGAVIGTTLYMSPEQIKRPHDVDPSTDVYSFGVVLFEMLTGTVPFDSSDGNDFVIKNAIVNDPPPRPSKLNPAVSKALESVILKALAKSPKERWPTCEDLAQALEAVYERERPPVRRTWPEGARPIPPDRKTLEPKPPARTPTKPPKLTDPPQRNEQPQQPGWFFQNRARAGILAAVLVIGLGIVYTGTKMVSWASNGRVPAADNNPVDNNLPSEPKKNPIPLPENKTSGLEPENPLKTGLAGTGSNPAHEAPVATKDSGHKTDSVLPKDLRNPKDTSAGPRDGSVAFPVDPNGARQKPPAYSGGNQGGSGTPATRLPDKQPVEIATRKGPDSSGQTNTPLPPVGTRVIDDTGATSLQRQEQMQPPIRKAPVEPVRPPEVKESPLEPPISARAPEKTVAASGTVMWSLNLKKNAVESLTGKLPSAGDITGEGLPGVPITVTITPPNIAGVVESPAPSNGWKTLKLRGLVNAHIVISVQWKRL